MLATGSGGSAFRQAPAQMQHWLNAPSREMFEKRTLFSLNTRKKLSVQFLRY